MRPPKGRWWWLRNSAWVPTGGFLIFVGASLVPAIFVPTPWWEWMFIGFATALLVGLLTMLWWESWELERNRRGLEQQQHELEERGMAISEAPHYMDEPLEERTGTVSGWRGYRLVNYNSVGDWMLRGRYGTDWQGPELQAVCADGRLEEHLRGVQRLTRPVLINGTWHASLFFDQLANTCSGSCGIYLTQQIPTPDYELAWARVSGWGIVFEAESGYRVEHARIEALWVNSRVVEGGYTERVPRNLAAALRLRYKVPVMLADFDELRRRWDADRADWKTREQLEEETRDRDRQAPQDVPDDASAGGSGSTVHITDTYYTHTLTDSSGTA